MSLRTVLIALIALAPIAAPALPPPVTSTWDGRHAARDELALQRVMLAEHNAAREAHDAPALRWNPALAADAEAYARRMAAAGVLQHDAQDGRPERQGENLFAGTRGAYSYAEMAGGWIEERRDFHPGAFPANSRSGDWTDVGHYTQMVWPETREVGCAVASNAQDDFLVCRYLPAGNVMGVALR
jgi:hypothetical protein